MIRTEFGRFTRQVSGYSLEHLLPENGADLAKFLAGTEGTLGVILGATVRAGAVAAGDRAGGARLPRTCPRPPTRCPALLPHRPVALEGMDARLVDVVRARRGAAAVPALPRGRRLAVRRDGGRHRGRGARRGRAGSSPTRGCLDSLVVTGAAGARRCGASARTARAWAAAPRPARRPGPAGRTPPCRPSSSAPYLRELRRADGRARPGRADLRALRRRLRARPHRLPARRPRRTRCRRFVVDAAQLVATLRRLDVRRARRRPGPRRAAARHVLGRGHRASFGRGQARSSTRATCSTRACSSTRRRWTRTCGVPLARPLRRGLGFAYSARRRRPVRRGAPLRRGRQVPGRHHRQPAA